MELSRLRQLRLSSIKDGKTAKVVSRSVRASLHPPFRTKPRYRNCAILDQKRTSWGWDEEERERERERENWMSLALLVSAASSHRTVIKFNRPVWR